MLLTRTKGVSRDINIVVAGANAVQADTVEVSNDAETLGVKGRADDVAGPVEQVAPILDAPIESKSAPLGPTMIPIGHSLRRVVKVEPVLDKYAASDGSTTTLVNFE